MGRKDEAKAEFDKANFLNKAVDDATTRRSPTVRHTTIKRRECRRLHQT